MYRMFLLVTLASALFTFGEVDAQSAKSNPKTPQAAVIDSINQTMQTFVDEGKIAGAVTLVGHQGKVVHLGAVGHANIASKREMKPFTLFAIASMTKPVTATSLMILQDEGKLNIHDKVSKYIPEFASVKLKDGSEASREITLFDCVTHTAGLESSQLFEGSLEAAVDQLAESPLGFQPGTKWKYSPGLNVAGRVVEIVSGKPLQDFMKERIFDPLKMSNTTFFPDEKQTRRVATIYQPGEDGVALVPAENRISKPGEAVAPNPSGGLFSCARDMFRFYQMILNQGRLRKQSVVSKDSVAAMTSPQTGELETGFTPGNCWGLGWCIVREPQGVTEMLSTGTFGHGGAFGTQGWVDPETKTIYVLMIQRTKMGNSDGSDVRKAFQQAANDALKL